MFLVGYFGKPFYRYKGFAKQTSVLYTGILFRDQFWMMSQQVATITRWWFVFIIAVHRFAKVYWIRGVNIQMSVKTALAIGRISAPRLQTTMNFDWWIDVPLNMVLQPLFGGESPATSDVVTLEGRLKRYGVSGRIGGARRCLWQITLSWRTIDRVRFHSNRISNWWFDTTSR